MESPPALNTIHALSEDSRDTCTSISSKEESAGGEQRIASRIILQKFSDNNNHKGTEVSSDGKVQEVINNSEFCLENINNIDNDNSNNIDSSSNNNSGHPAHQHYRDQSSTSQIDVSISGASVSNFMFPLAGEINEADDEPFETAEEQQSALIFAKEHRLFLRAALALLTERDVRAPTLGMLDPMVLKSGPLKKASHLMNGAWKVKYVEVRRGMFSYFENAINDGEMMRKNIPLQANDCTCRAVRLHQKALKFTPRGAIFELAVGGTKRLWLANSREERLSWIQAIHTATVGGSVTTSGAATSGAFDHTGRLRHVSPRSPFRQDLRLYLKIQNSLRQSKMKEDYISGLQELENRPIRVPINWIAKQTILNGDGSDIGSSGTNGGAQNGQVGAFKELDVDLSVEQLWRDLRRDSVSINGVVWQGNESHGPEAIVGAVAHSILRSSRESTQGPPDMMESQALAYARDIMLAGNRTRSGGDSYFCISTLCKNSELVVVTPSGMQAEPVALAVTEEKEDPNRISEGRAKSKSGWMKKRDGIRRAWKGFFFVLSEGTLSYYDGALPRPHGLRGVILLADATIKAFRQRDKDYFVFTIGSKDGKEHMIRIESEGRLVDWLYLLEREATAKAGQDAPSLFQMRRKSSGTKDDDAPSVEDGKSLAQQATEAHAKRLGLKLESVRARIATLALQTTSAVRIAIQACTEYNICTTDPSGVMEEDTWGVIRTHFQQSFRVTGGPGGRITRGEEIVRVSLRQYGGKDVVENSNGTESASSTPKRNRKKNIFRNFHPQQSEESLGEENNNK